MSWVTRIRENITVITGDGREYNPLYVILDKSVTYNIAQFNYPDIEGTLIVRGTPQGAVYRMELIFQGEDHLEQFKAFEQSAKDRRPWTIRHPFYDSIVVQPTSLRFDPSDLNLTRITGDVIETITEIAPRTTIDPRDNTSFSSDRFLETTAANFGSVQLVTSDYNQMSNDIQDAFDLGNQTNKTGNEVNEYFNLFTTASNAINLRAAQASELASFLNRFVIYPSLFTTQVKARLILLRQQFVALSEGLENLVTPNSKKIYELNAGTVVNASVMAAITPIDGDYTNVSDVTFVIGEVLDLYNSYITNLDSIQTDTGYDEDSFIPHYENANNLSELVKFALSQLFAIVLTAQQERTVIITKDSNPMLLAHRFYGLEVDDSTLTRFINENNIGINQYYHIPAGTEVRYYA